jgi:hypothetical protein
MSPLSSRLAIVPCLVALSIAPLVARVEVPRASRFRETARIAFAARRGAD